MATCVVYMEFIYGRPRIGKATHQGLRELPRHGRVSRITAKLAATGTDANVGSTAAAMRFTHVCYAAARAAAGSSARRGAGESARERIRKIDAAAQAAVAAHHALEALSLTSAHAAHVLEPLLAAAEVSEVPAADGGATWLLHHASAPGARLAELRLLPAVPVALGGRFDAGLRGGAGVSPAPISGICPGQRPNPHMNPRLNPEHGVCVQASARRCAEQRRTVACPSRRRRP